MNANRQTDSARLADGEIIHSISLRDAVFLIALARIGLEEDGAVIRPLYSYEVPLMPWVDDSLTLLACLFDRGFIDVCPSTHNEGVYVERGTVTLEMAAIEWQLTLGRDATESRQRLRNLGDALQEREKWPQAWRDDILPLWHQLALGESLSYLERKLADHGFDFIPGDKTVEMVLSLLNHFSIAQIFNFIWSAAKDAAAYYLRGGVTRERAANFVVGACHRRAERAISEGWQINGFRRDYRHAESVVAGLFSHVVTRLGDDYFTKAPNAMRIDARDD